MAVAVALALALAVTMAGCYLLDPSIIDAWLITAVSAKHNSQTKTVQPGQRETGSTVPGGLNTYRAQLMSI